MSQYTLSSQNSSENSNCLSPLAFLEIQLQSFPPELLASEGLFGALELPYSEVVEQLCLLEPSVVASHLSVLAASSLLPARIFFQDFYEELITSALHPKADVVAGLISPHLLLSHTF